MSTVLGEGFQPLLSSRPADRPDPLDELLIAVTLLRESLLSLPVPVVHVEPQDLSDVVQAVQGLAGPHSQLTAQDIAQAVREVLLPAPLTESTPEWTERLLEALERLDFRMKGIGGSGGGSSAVTVQNQPGTSLDVNLSQSVDAQNTITRTSADGATQFVGAWTSTRGAHVVRLLTVLASNVTSGLGGTFVFEFSEDGSTASISESRTIATFETVRDFDLINAGAYYRVKFTPSRALTGSEAVYITTMLRRQNDGAFVRLAGQQIEEANAAMPQTFAYLKGFDPRTGKSRNIRPDETGALRTRDSGQIISSSGSLFVESVRDDISISFSRDSYFESVQRIVAVASQVGTVSQNATDGRAVFSTGAGTGRVCYFESTARSIYEPGHEIIGEQTWVVPALTGTADVRWGYMEDDGVGGILNGLGFGIDGTGFYVWRTKGGVDQIKVRQTAFNRDNLNGVEPSLFRKAGVATAYQPTMNTLYRLAFEWLGISSPVYKIQTPEHDIIIAHVDETSNSQTGTTIPEPSMPMGIRVYSGDMAAGISVETGSWRGGIHTARTIPQGSLRGNTGQQTVTTVATLLGTSLEGRTSIRLKNMVGSARALYFGFAGSLTTANGDELNAGEAIDIDLDQSVPIYVITDSTAGAGVRCSFTELA